MTGESPLLLHLVLETLTAPGRVPVLLGGCGTGRTALLAGVRAHLGGDACQYVDVERIATTPERFHQALVASSPFSAPSGDAAPGSARAAFDAAVEFLVSAHARRDRATFLLDEVLEIRTFESFPGLRSALPELLTKLTHSGNRFVLASRYATRARRFLAAAGPMFEPITMPPLSPGEVAVMLERSRGRRVSEHDEEACAIAALADGRPGYVKTIGEALAAMDRIGGSDPISALTALMSPGGHLAAECRFCYELRLHRARGYGALKAILDVLAEREPMTLTEISQRLKRTPGSTKDYLSWLEDVDLVHVKQKRYTFADPLMRLWVRLHCRPTPPTEDEVTNEVHAYAMARLPKSAPAAARVTREPAMALAGAARGGWGIIEID